MTGAADAADATKLIGAATELDGETGLGGEVELVVASASAQTPEAYIVAASPCDSASSATLQSAFSGSNRAKSVTERGVPAVLQAHERSSFRGSDVRRAIFDDQPW